MITKFRIFLRFEYNKSVKNISNKITVFKQTSGKNLKHLKKFFEGSNFEVWKVQQNILGWFVVDW